MTALLLSFFLSFLSVLVSVWPTSGIQKEQLFINQTAGRYWYFYPSVPNLVRASVCPHRPGFPTRDPGAPHRLDRASAPIGPSETSIIRAIPSRVSRFTAGVWVCKILMESSWRLSRVKVRFRSAFPRLSESCRVDSFVGRVCGSLPRFIDGGLSSRNGLGSSWIAPSFPADHQLLLRAVEESITSLSERISFRSVSRLRSE